MQSSRAARRGPRWRVPCGAMVFVLVAHVLPGAVAFSCGTALVGLLCACALSEASNAAEKGRRSRLALLAATACAPAAAAGRYLFSSVAHRLAHLLAAVLLLAPARACSRLLAPARACPLLLWRTSRTTHASLFSSHPWPALPPRTRRTPLGGQCLKSRAGRACCVRETARISRRATIIMAGSGTEESAKGQKSDGKSLYQIPEDFEQLF